MEVFYSANICSLFQYLEGQINMLGDKISRFVDLLIENTERNKIKWSKKDKSVCFEYF